MHEWNWYLDIWLLFNSKILLVKETHDLKHKCFVFEFFSIVLVNTNPVFSLATYNRISKMGMLIDSAGIGSGFIRMLVSISYQVSPWQSVLSATGLQVPFDCPLCNSGVAGSPCQVCSQPPKKEEEMYFVLLSLMDTSVSTVYFLQKHWPKQNHPGTPGCGGDGMQCCSGQKLALCGPGGGEEVSVTARVVVEMSFLGLKVWPAQEGVLVLLLTALGPENLGVYVKTHILVQFSN